MNKSEAAHDAQVTFRLPHELDRQMRATSDYFRRSLTEEWRAAAVVYQRVLRLWMATRGKAVAGASGGLGTEMQIIAEVCDGVMLEPLSLEDLWSELESSVSR